jgi:uncharacterized membrane protein YidH (DUF202 family)
MEMARTILKATIVVVAVLMILSGAVWFLQGINLLPGSFMTGQSRWAVRGAIAMVVGLVLLVLASRLRPRAQP